MAFPQDVAGNKVEIFYDNAWHNITPGYVRGLGAEDGDIVIEARGEPDEATALQPTIARLSLNNRDGRFSPRNAASPLYGKIGANTPLRIATDLTSTLSIVDGFTGTRTNTWGSTDTSGHAWNNTGGSANDYDVAAGVGTHSHAASGVAHFSQILNTAAGDPLLSTDFDVYVLGISIAAQPTGDNVVVGFRGRLEVFEPNYVEAQITFNTANTVQYGVRYVIGYSQVAASSTPTISGALTTEQISFRFQAQGNTIRMKAWEGSTAAGEPSAWGVTLQQVTHTLAGYVMLYSSTGGSNSNTKPYVISVSSIDVSLGVVLFSGKVVEWPKKWELTGNDVWVPLVAAGITRQLRQGNRPIRSPLYRYYTRDLADLSLGTVETSIQHYWSMEDLKQQTRYIRDEIGNQIMSFSVATHNLVKWSDNDFVVGSGKLISIEGLPIPEGVVVVPMISSFDAPNDPSVAGFELLPTPDVADPDTTTFTCWFYFPPLLEDFPFLPATSLYFSFRVADSPIGNIFVDIQYRPDSNTFAGVLDSTSGDLADTGSLPYTDTPHFLVIDWFVDGSDLWSVTVYLDNAVILTDTASFRPFVHTTRFDVETEPYSPISIGHMTLETGTLFTRTLSFRSNIEEAGAGFPGETAVERFVRICNTEGVAYEVFSTQEDIDFPTLMGPQRPGNIIDHLDDISRADGGVIYELRSPFGYGFRTRASLYGVPASGYPLVLDYTNADLGEVPGVTDDDQKTRNVIRAKLRGGTQGELSYVVTDGPLGTENIGEYEEGGIEVALFDTSQLDDFVAWLGYLGTWDEDRWPDLTLHLHRAPFVNNMQQFIDALLLEIGQLILINNPPVWVGNDGVIQQMRAVAIRLSNFNISLGFTLLPGGPWGSLGTLNNTDADRADIEQCYLVSSVDDNDTDLIAFTYMTETPYDTPFWTRDPGEFNMFGHQGMSLRINAASRSGGLGGERVELGTTPPVSDTFTRSGAQLAGTNADTGQTWIHRQGTATNTTLSGSSAVTLHASANTPEATGIPTGDWDHSVHATATLNFTTATGADFRIEAYMRATDVSNGYLVRVTCLSGTASLTLQVLKVVGGLPTTLQLLDGSSTIAVGTNVSGTPIHIRGSVIGRDIYAKAWIDGTEEPDWQFVGLDLAQDVLNGEEVILKSFRLTSNTNVNASCTWDNFNVHTPLIRPFHWDRFAYTVSNDPDSAFPDDTTYPVAWNWFTAGLVEADLDFSPNQFQVTGSATLSYGAIYMDQVNLSDGCVSVVWQCPVPTGGDLEPGNIMMRGTSITRYILFRPYITPDNQMFARIYDRLGNVLGQMYVPPDAHRADRPMKTKAACFGTQLMMKVWDPRHPEPVQWGLVVTDPDPQSGWVGLRAGRGGSNTNSNAPMTFNEFRIENPQRLTVVRSANGVSRGWDAGSSVGLWSPLRLGR